MQKRTVGYRAACVCVGLVLLMLAGQVTAEVSKTARDQAAMLQPIIDNAVIAIIRIDVQAMDSATAEQRYADLPDPIKQMFQIGFDRMESERQRFLEAGVDDFYVLIRPFGLIFEPAAHTLIVLPTPAEANRDKVVGLFNAMMKGLDSTAQRGNVLLIGRQSTLNSLAPAMGQAGARNGLAAAMDEIDESALGAILIPSADHRRVLSEMMPVLPKELGGGPVTDLTEGLHWAVLGIGLKDGLSLRSVVQATDQQAAARIRQTIDGALDYLVQVARGESDIEIESFTKIVDAMRPQVEGDRLVTDLDPQQMGELAGKFIVRQVDHERDSAKQQTSVQHLKQIGLAIAQYSADHNRWPDDLEQVKPYLGPSAEAVLRNPRRPDLEVGYIYRKPTVAYNKMKDSPPQVIAYEDLEDMSRGVGILFQDGHVVFVPNRNELEKLLN